MDEYQQILDLIQTKNSSSILVSDACTTWSDQMHKASLETFNLALGWVRSTQQLIDLLQAVPQAA